ncbi:MAG: hypothetical protein GX346_01245 [Clostridiales bacterium]|nr:hypothetical protein [Clostridiales bacterium]
MSVKINQIEYKNYGKCLKMENDTCELIVTVDIGPRIISYKLHGKENVMKEDINRNIKNDTAEYQEYFGEGEAWYIYGGHRLWSSPERYVQSYIPDNKPVSYEIKGNSIFLKPEAAKTGEAFSMKVTLDENSSRVSVFHSITNILDEEMTLAPWALTVLAQGGVEVFPLNTKDTGLLSNRRNVLWPYSDINDKRFFISNKFATLSQDKNAETSFKIGINNEDGWAAYFVNEQMFLKRFPYNENAEYPDYGCNFETFTNAEFLECESLGSLQTLGKGDIAQLSENWELFELSPEFEARNEESIESFVKNNIILD